AVPVATDARHPDRHLAHPMALGHSRAHARSLSRAALADRWDRGDRAPRGARDYRDRHGGRAVMAAETSGAGQRAKAADRREHVRGWVRRSGRAGGAGHHDATGVSGDIPGLENLFQGLNEVGSGVAVRVRRKALQAIANELTKAAKKAVPKF